MSGSLLERINETGARFERLVFTENRRVLVSLGERGRALRLHSAFREAPPEVVSALGRMYGRPGRAGLTEARAVIRDFIHSSGTFPAPRAVAPRRRRGAPGDPAHLERLAAEFDRVNGEHFGGALPSVPIFISGRMRRRNGHFSPEPVEIVISRRLCTNAAPGEAEHTLRHEMIHLWQHLNGGRVGHGSDFRRWAVRLSVHPRARRAVRFAA